MVSISELNVIMLVFTSSELDPPHPFLTAVFNISRG